MGQKFSHNPPSKYPSLEPQAQPEALNFLAVSDMEGVKSSTFMQGKRIGGPDKMQGESLLISARLRSYEFLKRKPD